MREQIVLIDIVVVRVGEKVGHVVADLAEIDRQLASVGTSDVILARKSADFFHHLIHHNGWVMAFGEVSTCLLYTSGHDHLLRGRHLGKAACRRGFPYSKRRKIRRNTLKSVSYTHLLTRLES